MRHDFVVMEGTDGAGKSEQQRLFAARLRRERHIPVAEVSFPDYQTPIGRIIRQWLDGRAWLGRSEGELKLDGGRAYLQEQALTLQALMLVNRHERMGEIMDRLSGGAVVAARYIGSAFAYGGSDGLDLAWLSQIHEWTIPPTVQFLLKVPVMEAARRRALRKGQPADHYEKQGLESMQRISDRYDALFAPLSADARCWDRTKRRQITGALITIDGVGSVEAVHERIWDAYKRLS